MKRLIPSDLSLATEGQPKSIATHGNVAVVATTQKILVFQDNKKASEVEPGFAATSVAISVDGKEVAVGGEDFKVRLYSLSGTSLTAKPDVLDSNRGIITALAYSPDGKYLAVADADRKVLVYDTKTYELKFNEWVFHSSRVTSVAWSADSLYAVSGGLDRDVYVWSTLKPMKSVAIKGT